MKTALSMGLPAVIPAESHLVVPALISNAGDNTALRFVDFFATNIRNSNTERISANRAGYRFPGKHHGQTLPFMGFPGRHQ